MAKRSRLDTYTWNQLRPSFALIWIGITVLTGCIYAGVVVKDRGTELQSWLRIAGYTIGTSLQAQDWDLALGHLKVTTRSSHLFELELLSAKGDRIAGPLGDKPFGLGQICRSMNDRDLEIRGCSRVLGKNDCIALIFLFLSSFGFFRIAQGYLRRRIQLFMGRVSQELENIRTSSEHAETEVQEIIGIRKQVQSLLLEVEENANDAAFGRIAASVSHDIRGAIHVLDFLLATLPEIPEKKRMAIQDSLARVKDIVDDLKLKSKQHLGSLPEDSTKVHSVNKLLSLVASQKRIEHRGKSGIKIEFFETFQNRGIFVSVSETSFYRVFSNLIDNAVDSIDEEGQICLEVRQSGERVILSIIDNGKGVASDLIPRLGSRGATFGKSDGSGLGLFFCKSRVSSWNGSLSIHSSLGKGTCIEVSLPMAVPPSWFVERIDIPKSDASMVVLDDDPNIHELWRMKFRETHAANALFFDSADSFKDWFMSGHQSEETLYLIDYELSKDGETGLDLIQSLDINNQSILVTHRDEPELIQRCEEMKVRFFLKSHLQDIAFHN